MRSSGKLFGRDAKVRITGTGAMKAKVLCRRHNSCLSPLDAVGLRFQQAIQNVLVTALPELPLPVGPHHILVNGHDVERWMLKTLLGVVASGQAGFDFPGGEHKVRNVDIDRETLAELFDGRLMDAPRGLYVRSNPEENVGAVSQPYSDLGLRVLLDPVRALVLGLEQRLTGADLVLWTAPPELPIRPDLHPLIYRPSAFVARRGAHLTCLELDWVAADPSRYVEVLQAHYVDGRLSQSHWKSGRWGHPPDTDQRH